MIPENDSPRRRLGRFELSRRAGRDGATLVAFKTVELTLRTLCDYHEHRVIGLDNLTKVGPALVVFNHSFATYDSFLLTVVVFDELDRVMRGVADRLVMRTPGIGELARRVGVTAGSRDELVELLETGEIVGLAPGGMREALRLGRKKYEVDWKRRTGFVRVSVETGAPIVLAACPLADDIYTFYENPLTSWAYRKYRVPVPAFRGMGPTPIPRPIKLTHLLSEPIHPPEGRERATEDQIAAHHAYLEHRMSILMQEALRASFRQAKYASDGS